MRSPGRSGATRLPASLITASTSSTLRPGRTTSRGDRERGERHGAQDLDRDPADEHARGLDGPAEQRRGRPGVLRAGVPRAARELRRDEAVAVALVERGHAGEARISRSGYGLTERPDHVRQSSLESALDRRAAPPGRPRAPPAPARPPPARPLPGRPRRTAGRRCRRPAFRPGPRRGSRSAPGRPRRRAARASRRTAAGRPARSRRRSGARRR